MILEWTINEDGSRHSTTLLRITSLRVGLKKIALSGHPCLTPEWIGIGGFLSSKMRTSIYRQNLDYRHKRISVLYVS